MRHVIPAVAVGTVEHWIANEYYPSDEAFLFALADALREEYTAIVEAGFLLQLDNPNLPDGFGLYTDLDIPAYRQVPGAAHRGAEPLHRGAASQQDTHARLLGRPQGATQHGRATAGHRRPDARTCKVEAYSVEAANPRHAHEWHVWEHVKLPAGKILIPGVVGHDSDTIEHPELVAERLCNYASVVGRDNVIAGTDCGFGTSRLHPTIAQLKFQAMVRRRSPGLAATLGPLDHHGARQQTRQQRSLEATSTRMLFVLPIPSSLSLCYDGPEMDKGWN